VKRLAFLIILVLTFSSLLSPAKAADIGISFPVGLGQSDSQFELGQSIWVGFEVLWQEEVVAALPLDSATTLQIPYDSQVSLKITFVPRNIPKFVRVDWGINDWEKLTPMARATRTYWQAEIHGSQLKAGLNAITLGIWGRFDPRRWDLGVIHFTRNRRGRTDAVISLHTVVGDFTDLAQTCQWLASRGWILTTELSIPAKQQPEKPGPAEVEVPAVVPETTATPIEEISILPAAPATPEPVTVGIPANKIDYTVILAGRKWPVGNKEKVTVHHSQFNRWTLVAHFPRATEGFSWKLTREGHLVDSKDFSPPDDPQFETFWIESGLSPGYYKLEIKTDYGLQDQIGIEVIN